MLDIGASQGDWVTGINASLRVGEVLAGEAADVGRAVAGDLGEMKSITRARGESDAEGTAIIFDSS
jgi:hypothetical protein